MYRYQMIDDYWYVCLYLKGKMYRLNCIGKNGHCLEFKGRKGRTW